MNVNVNDVGQAIMSIGVGKVVVPNGKGLMAALDADDTAPLLETWDVVQNDNPQDAEVPNWANDAKFQEFSRFLKEFGVHAHLAETIFQHYGPSAMTVVQSDPYRLVREVAGIGFKTADSIDRGLGMLPNTSARLDAGVIYALRQTISDGHVYVPLPYLIGRASQLLKIDEPGLRSTLGRLETNGQIRPEARPGNSTVAIYPTSLYRAEIGVVAALRCMLGTAESRLWGCGNCVDSDVTCRLSSEQHEAVSLALSSKVSILTGQPAQERPQRCGRSSTDWKHVTNGTPWLARQAGRPNG